MEQAFQPETADEESDPPRTLPGRLWERLRADPVRAPEHLALAASEFHGPAAREWVRDMRARTALQPPALAEITRKRHARLARFSGAAGGVGGAWTMLPEIAVLAWVQSRMVFYIAGAYGWDPCDRMRPAELLVIRGFYRTPAEARDALDGVGRTLAEQYVGGHLSRDEKLLARLTKLTMRKGGAKLAGKAIPGIAIAFNAVSDERETRAVGKDAIRFYGG